MKPIYLDHAAATPLLPEVLDAMLPLLREQYGNPSSLHRFGRDARAVLSRARETIAGLLHCAPKELIFTGGGTEADNAAIFGLAPLPAGPRNHIITSAVEHHAVLHACERLEQAGYEVTYLPADASGLVSVEDVEAAITPRTLLISVMYGNNEVGSIQPVSAIGLLARSRGIPFHVDAVQAAGMVPIDLSALPVDLMSFSAHKLGGPKGIGALYCSSRIHLSPLIYGGAQERRKRAGTEDVAAAAGFAEALRLAVQSMGEKRRRMEELREHMLRGLEAQLGLSGFVVNGPSRQSDRLPHILHVSFPGCATETLLMRLDLEGIAAASGSACTSGSLELSHVLTAMGLPQEVAASAVRFSFGPATTFEEIATACEKVGTIVKRLRK
ncbi:cysteine desulfurase family protein [Paenibacillus sp. YN15]|uniref:cysteine desulfurase family protein n=1 Tax=Paenibacillus sp. YN15 TaxID=1742774 RepID=UPI000DCEFE13|nr:cysteine desulfurase family protein [Paenibacillus sp. YN15]RAU93050.1 cysteine desulfurase NifS [Paenibacillus sp. YN15]